MKKLLILILFGMLFIQLWGCRSSVVQNDPVSIDGTVTLDGKPLGNVIVIFCPTHGLNRSIGTGTNDKGQFRWASASELQPDEYRVCVEPFPDQNNTLKVAIPEEYGNSSVSPLVVQLKGGNNVVNLELSSKR